MVLQQIQYIRNKKEDRVDVKSKRKSSGWVYGMSLGDDWVHCKDAAAITSISVEVKACHFQIPNHILYLELLHSSLKF